MSEHPTGENPDGTVTEIEVSEERPANLVTPTDEIEHDTSVHYRTEAGYMLHAVPDVGQEIWSSDDRPEVTCEVCRGLIQAPVHYVRENGLPLHPADDGDGAEHDPAKVTCEACKTLIEAGEHLAPEPEPEPEPVDDGPQVDPETGEEIPR